MKRSIVLVLVSVLMAGCNLMMDDLNKVDGEDTESGISGSDGGTDSGSDKNGPGGTDSTSETGDNRTPELTFDGITAGLTGAMMSVDLTVSDADGDAVTLSLVNAPEGVVLDGDSGRLTYTPAADVATGLGAKTDVVVEVLATDDGTPVMTDSLIITFTVTGDVDVDGIGDRDDNCPLVANPLQVDYDQDGVGMYCDSLIFIPESVSRMEEIVDSLDDGIPPRMSHNVRDAQVDVNGRYVGVGFGQDEMDWWADDSMISALLMGVDESVTVLEADRFPSYQIAGPRPDIWDDGTIWFWQFQNPVFSVNAADVTERYGNPDGPYSASMYDFGEKKLFYANDTFDLWDGMSGPTTIFSDFKQVTRYMVNDAMYAKVVEADDSVSLYYIEADGTKTLLLSNEVEVTELDRDDENDTSMWFCTASDVDGSRVIAMKRFENGVETLATRSTLFEGSDSCYDVRWIQVESPNGVKTDFDPLGTYWLNVYNDVTEEYWTWSCRAQSSYCKKVEADNTDARWVGVMAGGETRYVYGDRLYKTNATGDGAVLVYNGAPSGMAVNEMGVVGWHYRNETGGTSSNPTQITAFQYDGTTMYSDVLQQIDGYYFPHMHWTWVAPDGVVWYRIRQGDGTSGPNNIFAYHEGTEIEYENTGSDTIATALVDSAGNALIYTDGGIYRPAGTTLHTVRSTLSKMELLHTPSLISDMGYYWVGYQRTNGKYALARWKNGVFEDILTDASGMPAVLVRDAYRYVFFEDGLGWNISLLAGDAFTPVKARMSAEPVHLPVAEYDWIIWQMDGALYLSELKDGLVTAPVLWSDDTLEAAANYEGAVDVVHSDVDRGARCALREQPVRCTDLEYVEGTTLDQMNTDADAAGNLAGVYLDRDNLDVYLWRSVLNPAPDSCCTASDSPACDSVAMAACVCAYDDTCCSDAWTESCIETLNAHCGSCYVE